MIGNSINPVTQLIERQVVHFTPAPNYDIVRYREMYQERAPQLPELSLEPIALNR
jgi:hypothetical protein